MRAIYNARIRLTIVRAVDNVAHRSSIGNHDQRKLCFGRILKQLKDLNLDRTQEGRTQ